MKIRNGFVSNSSSSSFLIYGTVINSYDLYEDQLKNIKDKFIMILKSYNGNNDYLRKKSKEMLEYIDEMSIEEFKSDLEEYMDEISKFNKDIDVYIVDDEIFIGRDPVSNDNDNITFGDWKKSIEEDIKFLIPFSKSFTWLENCRYNG